MIERLRERLRGQARETEDVGVHITEIARQIAAKKLEQDGIITQYRRGRITEAQLDKQLDDLASETTALEARQQVLFSRQVEAQTREAAMISAEEMLPRLRERVDEIERNAASPNPEIATAALEDKRDLIKGLLDGIEVDEGGAVNIRYVFVDCSVRVTTRVSHSKSIVRYDETAAATREAAQPFVRQPEKYVMIPANARRRHPAVEQRVEQLAEFAETFSHNRVELRDESAGIITAGVAYQYAREVMPDASFLKLGMGYPMPARMIREFAERVDRLVVVEELDPFIEEAVKALGLRLEGKRCFPIVGELSVESVEDGFRKAGLLRKPQVPPVGAGGSAGSSGRADTAVCPYKSNGDVVAGPTPLPLRPPVLCPGCPHTGAFFILRKLGFYRSSGDAAQTLPGQILARLKRSGVVIAGDIGCYTLGVLPPLLAMDTCGCMGASIGSAMGMEMAGLPNKVVAVIGDSTFLHSGITSLLNVVYNGGTITTIILDNSTTAMTGHQDHPGTGKSAQGRPARSVDLEKLVRGLGIEDVKVANAFNLEQLTAAIRDSVERDEPSVVIARGDCALKVRAAGDAYVVDQEKCDGCGACLRTGCPAIVRRDGRAEIQPGICVGAALRRLRTGLPQGRDRCWVMGSLSPNTGAERQWIR